MKPAALVAFAAVALAACAPPPADEVEPAKPLGYAALEQASPVGPAVKAGGATEVWAARNKWSDTSTPAARAAGIAWGESSGLTWEQKYWRWVGSLPVIDRGAGGKTFLLTTPFAGKSLPAPTLECAEVALFLRATFASWYELPFFVKGWDPEAKRSVYAGHFGFVTESGAPIASFPSFNSRYVDYTKPWKPGQPWPRDEKLRRTHLGSDDTVDFLDPIDGKPAGAGAYFDEVFLNKRTGWFIRLLLLYFGSVNLADGSNMYHLEPEAIAPGDLLLHRWQKKGIGHVMPILRASSPLEGRLSAEIASGSMPRRQPLWQDPLAARSYFLQPKAGGPGVAHDGTPYAELGGGVRRFRTPVLKNGRWYNEISDSSVHIADGNVEAIAARPARFDEILVSGTPEEQLATAVAKVEGAREHLREHPASCSARTNRELAFEELYAIAAEHFGKTREEVDAEHRVLEDYVFGELQYEASKTCCWNSSTAAMADIVLDFAKKEQEAAEAAGVCATPTVFRARPGGDGYALWKAHAEAIGRASDWLAWSADESCPQAGVVEDTETGRGGVPWCSLAGAEEGTGGGSGGSDDLPQTGDPCGDVTWEGECHDAVLLYCSGGALVVVDCAAQGQTCGWHEQNAFFDCL